jgi:hypothetical protein
MIKEREEQEVLWEVVQVAVAKAGLDWKEEGRKQGGVGKGHVIENRRPILSCLPITAITGTL